MSQKRDRRPLQVLVEDKKTRVKEARCPLSGISCSECDYEPYVSGNAKCFLMDLVTALNRIAEALESEN